MRYIDSWILSGYVRICVVLCKFAGKHLSVSVFRKSGQCECVPEVRAVGEMRYIDSWILSGYVRICVVLCKFAGKHLSVSVFRKSGQWARCAILFRGS